MCTDLVLSQIWTSRLRRKSTRKAPSLGAVRHCFSRERFWFYNFPITFRCTPKLSCPFSLSRNGPGPSLSEVIFLEVKLLGRVRSTVAKPTNRPLRRFVRRHLITDPRRGGVGEATWTGLTEEPV